MHTFSKEGARKHICPAIEVVPVIMTSRAATLVGALFALVAVASAQNPNYQALHASYNCKVPGKTACTKNEDCIDPTGKMGGIVTTSPANGGTAQECGWSYCDGTTGVCHYGPFNKECKDSYTACGEWNTTTNAFDKNDGKCNTGKVPKYIKSVGVCNGYDNNECVHAWCPNDIKPSSAPTKSPRPTFAPTPRPTSAVPDPLYENYACPATNKCSKDSDCFDDANGVTGARSFCGTTFCDTGGVCRIYMWNYTCPEFVQCARTHSLCYNGPSGVNYMGSCSGYENNECKYAWCPNTPPAATTTTTTAAPPGPPVDVRVPSSITITRVAGGDLKMGGNNRYKAVAAFNTGSEDITAKATWTSSDPGLADFDFPGVIEAKAVAGSFSIKASFNGVSSPDLQALVSPTSGVPTCGAPKLKMKVLVIYQSEALDQQRGKEATVPAIQRALGYLGIPYDMVRQDLLGSTVSWSESNCLGNYQAVIVSDGGLRWQPGSFNDKKGYHLDDYQVNFDVRVINWFTWPSPAFGWSSSASGTSDEIPCSLTPAGQSVFSYINPSYQIKLKHVWNQVAKPNTNSPDAIPLLMDANGNAHVMLYTSGKREMLTMTFGSNEHTRHSTVLSYGVLNWATRGQFIGFRRVYIRADIDDFFIDDDIYAPSVPCGTPTDKTGIKWRMAKEDMEAVIAWQKGIYAGPDMYKEVVLDLVFNAIGSTCKRFCPDTLTPLALRRDVEKLFRWISHGWDHLNEDKTSYRVAWEEVYHNQIVAEGRDLNLTQFARDAMVTGQVSGLNNTRFLTAARDLGIRYLVGDTSRSYENPGDNKGLYNWFVPEIFLIPRRPNNLFYNVALPEEWAHQYNCIFRAFWGKDFTVSDIVDFEAEQLLSYMLRGEKYPWMFHQANLRAYNKPGVGTKFLLEELLDAIFAKYSAIYNIPITSPAMDVVGRDIISHNEIETAKVEGVVVAGIGAKFTAKADTRMPLTGFEGEENRIYGGQNQCYARLKANSAPKFVPYKA